MLALRAAQFFSFFPFFPSLFLITQPPARNKSRRGRSFAFVRRVGNTKEPPSSAKILKPASPLRLSKPVATPNRPWQQRTALLQSRQIMMTKEQPFSDMGRMVVHMWNADKHHRSDLPTRSTIKPHPLSSHSSWRQILRSIKNPSATNSPTRTLLLLLLTIRATQKNVHPYCCFLLLLHHGPASARHAMEKSKDEPCHIIYHRYPNLLHIVPPLLPLPTVMLSMPAHTSWCRWRYNTIIFDPRQSQPHCALHMHTSAYIMLMTLQYHHLRSSPLTKNDYHPANDYNIMSITVKPTITTSTSWKVCRTVMNGMLGFRQWCRTRDGRWWCWTEEFLDLPLLPTCLEHADIVNTSGGQFGEQFQRQQLMQCLSSKTSKTCILVPFPTKSPTNKTIGIVTRRLLCRNSNHLCPFPWNQEVQQHGQLETHWKPSFHPSISFDVAIATQQRWELLSQLHGCITMAKGKGEIATRMASWGTIAGDGGLFIIGFEWR